MKHTLTAKEQADLRKKLTDWNTARPLIRSFLTTAGKANRTFEHTYPFYRFFNTGLIVTFYMVLSEDEHDVEILNIDDRLLKGWNIDLETLKQAAANGDATRGYEVARLADLIGDIDGEAAKTAYCEASLMDEYVIVTKPETSVSYAASGLVTAGVREQLKRLFPGGCYIFPASIHDIIIVSKAEIDADFAELLHDNITREVHSKDASRYNPDSDFLTDTILQYNAHNDTFSVAGSDIE